MRYSRKRPRDELTSIEIGKPDKLLVPMAQLWQEGLFCDVEVVVEQRKFLVHRLVVSSASEFMKRAFSNAMSEDSTGPVTLEAINEDIFAAVLEWIYLHHCCVRDDMLEALLEAANRLEIRGLKEATASKLAESIDYTNCIEKWRLGESTGAQSLSEAAEAEALDHFKEVVESDAFVTCDASMLARLLSSDRLYVSREGETFEALRRWHDSQQNRPSSEVRRPARATIMFSRSLCYGLPCRSFPASMILRPPLFNPCTVPHRPHCHIVSTPLIIMHFLSLL